MPKEELFNAGIKNLGWFKGWGEGLICPLFDKWYFSCRMHFWIQYIPCIRSGGDGWRT